MGQERQQKNEREIAEIAFAEPDVLQCTEIPQPRPSVIKDFFTAFERAENIPGQQLLQNQPSVTVVEQPIVATVERPYTAEEAAIVDGNRHYGQTEQDQGQDLSLIHI